MNKILVVTALLHIEPMSNIVLAAANNAITGFNKITPPNLAFEPMKKAMLIKDDGTPFDKESLLAALSLEINKRIESGQWN